MISAVEAVKRTARVTKAILLARCALPKRDARLIWSLRKSLIVVVAQVLFSSTPIHHAAAETVQLVHKDGDYLESVKLNNTLVLPFVLDTGATNVAIPSDVF